jgi:hypothetical protein
MAFFFSVSVHFFGVFHSSAEGSTVASKMHYLISLFHPALLIISALFPFSALAGINEVDINRSSLLTLTETHGHKSADVKNNLFFSPG